VDVATEVRPIGDFQIRDVEPWPNQLIADNCLGTVFGTLDIPLVGNEVSPGLPREVAEDCTSFVSDLVTAPLEVRPIRDFSRRVSEPVSEKVDEIFTGWLWFEADHLPLLAHSVLVDQIAAEIVLDDPNDTLPGLVPADSRVVKSYVPTEASSYAALTSPAVRDRIMCPDFPIASNRPTPRQVESIVSGSPVFDINSFSVVDCEGLNCPQRPVEIYAGSADAAERRSRLFDSLELPVSSNRVTSRICFAIAEASFSQAVLLHTPDLRPLIGFEIPDGEQSINVATIDDLFDAIFESIEDDLPLGPNRPTDDDIAGVTEDLFMFNVSVPLDISAFTALHPIEGGIDFGLLPSAESLLECNLPIISNQPTRNVLSSVTEDLFPFSISSPLDVSGFRGLHPVEGAIDFRLLPSAECLLQRDCRSLPIASNTCNSTMSSAILTVLSSVFSADFPLRDVAPLSILEAPEDVTELIDATVERLMALILIQDVVPSLPLCPEASPELLECTLAGLMDIDDALRPIAALPIDVIMQLKPNDIPTFVTPAELLEIILETQIFPTVRFEAADIEDILILDGGPAIAGDELDDPAIAAMLSQYTKRRPYQR
jgi:hypothetical protein